MSVNHLRDFTLGDRELVWMCRLAREHPGLKPLAFEALLRSAVAVWVDARYFEPGDAVNEGTLPFRHLRHPDGGIAEFAAVFFTDLAHFNAFVRESGVGQRQCYVPQDTQEVLGAVAANRLPLVIDPGSRHSLYLTAYQVREWLTVWESGEPQTAGPPRGREFQPWLASQLLLDRLAAFLAQFGSLDGAWVCRLGERTPSRHEGGTLLLSSMGTEGERIRRALPLLSQGLSTSRALNWVAPLTRPFEDMPAERRALLTPVYDRSMSIYKVRRR